MTSFASICMQVHAKSPGAGQVAAASTGGKAITEWLIDYSTERMYLAMDREKEIEKVLDEVKQLTHDEKEEFLAGLQIISGKAPANPAAALRLTKKVAECQEKGTPVPAALLRNFAG